MKPATMLTTLLLCLVALGHLLRLITRTEIIAAGTVIPLWISVPGFLVALALAIGLWREHRA